MLTKIAAVLVFAGVLHAPAEAQTPTGTEVLKRMHDAYAGRWYRTLTFTQKTTRWLPDGTQREDIWREYLRHFDDRGTLLRIDMGDPAAGNSVVFSTDSTWVMRGGKFAAVRPGGNEFLPLIEGVYMQPVEKTAQELTNMGFDLSRTASAEWQGKPVWIVGASSADDSTHAQFWVEKERNVVVRALLLLPQAPPLEVRLGKYVPAGRGWLATFIEMDAGGKPFQHEEYSDYKVNVDVSADLFDTASWPRN